jgi:hypothetical protein
VGIVWILTGVCGIGGVGGAGCVRPDMGLVGFLYFLGGRSPRRCGVGIVNFVLRI